MWNQELKERFIEEMEDATITKHMLKRLFGKKTVQDEQLLQKDVSNFTSLEIKNMYKGFAERSIPILFNYNSQLSKYTDWCIKQGLVKDRQNHFKEFSSIDLETFVNLAAIDKRIIDRQQVLDWCDQLINVGDKFLLLAIFEGIAGDGYSDIVNLKISDFNGNQVKLKSGRVATVSDELVKYAAASAVEYTCVRYGETLRPATFKDDDGLIIKLLPQVTSSGLLQATQRITTQLSRIKNFLGIDKAIHMLADLSRAGLIYCINTEATKKGITAVEYLTPEVVNELQNKFPNVAFKQTLKTFLRQYKKYLV